MQLKTLAKQRKFITKAVNSVHLDFFCAKKTRLFRFKSKLVVSERAAKKKKNLL
jgi:hypothetical protein